MHTGVSWFEISKHKEATLFSFTDGSTVQCSHDITSVVARGKRVAQTTRTRVNTDAPSQRLVCPLAQGRCKLRCLRRRIQQSSRPSWWTLRGCCSEEGKCDPDPDPIAQRARLSPRGVDLTRFNKILFYFILLLTELGNHLVE